jgi:valyl-tRNA synthetase
VHHGKDINLDLNVLISIRQFCNKIWNTFKFVMMNLGDDYVYRVEDIDVNKLQLADKWILTELNNSIKNINECLAGHHYSQATDAF